MSERRDGDRIVVGGYSAGSHFPRTQAATQYRLELDGLSREGAFLVDGSVFGRDLRLRGPGAVLGPILGRGDIALENHSGQPQKLMAGLHASGNIVAKSRGGALAGLLGAGLRNVDYVIRGDVVAENVNLENAVVFGNVRGRRVRLTGCLVLGQILSTEEAVVAASTFLAYEAPSLRIEGPCCALHALGSSDRAPLFADFTDGAGKRWPAEVVLYPALFAGGEGALLHRPGDGASFEGAKLHPADWIRVDAIKLRRRVQGERVVEDQVRVERHVLSIGGRALNFTEVTRHIERLTWMLKTVLEFDHYHPNVRQRVQREWLDRCRGDERALLDLALPPTAPEAAQRPPERAAAPTAVAAPTVARAAPPPVAAPVPMAPVARLAPAPAAVAPATKPAAPVAVASAPRPVAAAPAAVAQTPAPAVAAAPAPAKTPAPVAVAPAAKATSSASAPPPAIAARPAVSAGYSSVQVSRPMSVGTPAAVARPAGSEWMLRRPGGTAVGPAATEKVVQAIGLGKVPIECSAAPAGSEDWRPVTEIPEFAEAVARARASG